VQNIDLSKGYCLIVTDQRHAKITFGLDRLDAQLSRLYRCFDRAAQDHKELQTVNLLVERNIPVTFFDPEAEAAAAAAEEVAASGKPPKGTPEERPSTPKPPEVRRAESVSPKSSPKTTPNGRGASGNQSLRKPFRLNP
jgi:hypothetical protein